MADLIEIFTLTPIPTVTLDTSLCIQRASKSFLRTIGANSEEWQGANYLELLRSRALIGEVDTHRIRDAIDAASRTFEVQFWQGDVTEDGKMTQMRVVPIVNDHTLLSYIVEWQPSVKKEVVNRLIGSGLATDEAFRILVGAVKDYAIFLLDPKGNVVTWNIGAELSKGYKPHEIIGKHFSIFYGEEDLKANKTAKELEICLRDGRVEDEGWRYRKDGSRFWANVVITAIYDNGAHVGFGKVTRDLTERKAAESRLIAAYEESSNLKSEFLANMSHEIRTPMHGMLSANTLLLDTELTQRQKELVDIIEDSGQVLLHVINDILDYSKLSSGSFSLSSDIVGVTNILNSVVRNFQVALRPGVHFELHISPNLPKSAQGDPLRYRQIAHNLISNAVKFTERGFIRVHAALHREDEGTYTIYTEIQDTGVGISETVSSSLFTPFHQLENTRTKAYSGTGLGLSICKSLVELMGGQIGYLPNPDRNGSVFWFTTLFKKIAAPDAMANLTKQMAAVNTIASDIASAENLQTVFETKTILLAEDNIINQKVILMMLRSLGFLHIDVAKNGAEAVQSVNSALKGYDLILMDINMPLIDGVAATIQIRCSGSQIPIIAMTANALKGDRDEYIAKGMNDYISKPVDKVHLIRMLKKWLVLR